MKTRTAYKMAIGVAIFAIAYFLFAKFNPFVITEEVQEAIVILVGGFAIYLVWTIVHGFKGELKKSDKEKRAMMHLFRNFEASKKNLEKEKIKEDAILAGIGDGVAVIDELGCISFVNPILEEMTGRSQAELLEKDWEKPFALYREDGSLLALDQHPIRRAMDIKSVVKTAPIIMPSARYLLSGKSGAKFNVQITASPIFAGGEPHGVVAVFRDVSKEVLLEQTKSEFVSIASHQLRAPLSTISWYSEMLLGGDFGSLNEKQTEYLNEIYKGNKRMIDLVNALLNVSRLEMGSFVVEPTAVILKDVIEEILEESRAGILRNNIKIEAAYDKNIPEVKADRNLAKIIIQNLVSNAIKYTGDRITISVSAQNGTSIEGFNGKGAVLIRVSDNGIGIPANQRGQIFTKLFRADNARQINPEGTGLGLYVIKSIIDQTKGKIWFESSEGKGTTFYILIPANWMEARRGTRKLAQD